MEIRLLAERPEFVPTVAGWLFEQFGHLNPGASRERAEIRIRERLNTAGYPIAFIALENGTPIGTASLVDNDLEECPQLSPWLAGLFVLPQHRRCGHGAHLVSLATDHTRRGGSAKLHLFTPDRQAFFRKLGWVESQRLLHRQVPVSVMERAL
jgi:GNAT superfamily N-acetyltransferase